MNIWAAISGSRERSQSSVSPPDGFDPGRKDFTIADVLAWARTKPVGERYEFLDPGNCAVAQFGRETGREYLVHLGDIDEYSQPLRLAVMGDGRHRTFGGLVANLEALCPETPVARSKWSRLDAYMAAEQVSA